MKQKHTLLDYAILGLLKADSLSGYQIRKIFETTALGNFSSSPGTIYPALKRLEKFDLIERKKESTTNKARIHLTSIGLDVLKEWLLKAPDITIIAKNVDELLLRFAFMDHLVTRDQQVAFVQDFRQLLRPYIQELTDYREQEFSNMTSTALLAFDHGIMSYKTTLKWCDITLKKLKQTTNHE